MDRKQFLADVTELLKKYPELAIVVLGITYESPDGIQCYGNTFIPVPPRDHEEELLRDNAAKQVSRVAADLTKNVYL